MYVKCCLHCSVPISERLDPLVVATDAAYSDEDYGVIIICVLMCRILFAGKWIVSQLNVL